MKNRAGVFKPPAPAAAMQSQSGNKNGKTPPIHLPMTPLKPADISAQVARQAGTSGRPKAPLVIKSTPGRKGTKTSVM